MRNLSMHLLAAPVSNRARRLLANRGLRDQTVRIMPTVPVVAASAHRQNAELAGGRSSMNHPRSPRLTPFGRCQRPCWCLPGSVP